jgi:hypothetical protein
MRKISNMIHKSNKLPDRGRLARWIGFRWSGKRTSRSRLLGLSAVSYLWCGIAVAQAQEVWFAPLLPRAPHTKLAGAADWAALFSSVPSWPIAAAATRVFTLNPGYITDASDADLSALAANLLQNNMVVGVGVQPVATTSADPCGHTEGYDDVAHIVAVVNKLNKNGLIPKYIALDEPLWFGHYATGAQECNFSVEEMAQRTAVTVNTYIQAFPGVTVGDIEPIGALTAEADWKATYGAYKTTLEGAIGQRLAFLQLDVQWTDPGWTDHMSLIASFAHRHGMRLGVIYNGDGGDTDDVSWLAHAKKNFDYVESLTGIRPAQAIFISWNKFPTHAMPETSPSAHTWLIDQYMLPRTRFTWQTSVGNITGRLITEQLGAVANATVEVQALGMDPKQPPVPLVVSDIVPAGARFAIMGMRVNRECFCAGDNDLIIGDFQYKETQGGSIAQTYSFPGSAALAHGPSAKVLPMTLGGVPLAEIIVTPVQQFGFNSPIFAVTPGSRFTFTAPIGSVTGKGMFGTATVIWLDAAKSGFLRSNITLEEDVRSIGSVATDANGQFVTTRPVQANGKLVPLRLHFAGTANQRSAYAVVQ